jgi:PASTA domain-containing protein
MSSRTAAILSCVMALVFTGPAAATPVVDQQQVIRDPNVGALIGGSGPQVMAQVVRSGMAGLLTEVRLPLGCDNSTLVVRIFDAVTRPGDTVLATQTVAGLPATDDWKSIALASPPFIPKGSGFAIVLSSSGTCWVGGGSPNTNPYVPGEGWYQGPPNPPGVWSFAGLDLAFMTFVERICKVPALVGNPQTEVEGTLEKYGCIRGRVTRAFSRTVVSGDVISQSHPEGTQLAAGATVDVRVSLGPPPCTVPNVRGKTLARAKSVLARAGCRAGRIRRARSAKALKGRVIRQSPKPGRRISDGGRVNLVLGGGPA